MRFSFCFVLLFTSSLALAKEPEPAESSKNARSAGEFVVRPTDGASPATKKASKIKATATHAALKFFVVEKDKGTAIPGIVISLRAPNGQKYYTDETDADGYAEVLVPSGIKYDVVYLSLGRGDVNAQVNVPAGPRHNLTLTLRYKRVDDEPEAAPKHFILEGIQFDIGKATLRPESYPRLDEVVEYLKHKTSTRIEIAGHSDNAGNPKTNKALSERRAQACRDYLVAQGIDTGRIVAVGYGDERPIAPNDTEDGRQKNRRIEATEL